MKSNLFLKTFPTPKFLVMPAIGMSISDRLICVADIHRTQFGDTEGIYKKYAVPEGVIEKGEIKNEGKLKELLIKIKREQDLKYVNIALPENLGYVVVLEIPKISMKEIRGAIEMKLEEHVPLPIKDILFDYDIISGDKDNLEKNYLVDIAVYPRKVINEYTNLFSGVGIGIKKIENEVYPIKRAVVKDRDKSTVMIVDAGIEKTSIFIISNGAIYFTSTVDIGSSMLARVTERAMGIDFKEAEKLNNSKGLVIGSRDDEELALAQIPTVSALRDEISRHVLYWDDRKEVDKKKHGAVSKIVMCGDFSNFKGLVEYLGANLKVEVKKADVFSNITQFRDYIPEIHKEESLQYATAIGLTINN